MTEDPDPHPRHRTVAATLKRIEAFGRWVKRNPTTKSIRSIAEFAGKMTIFLGVLSYVFEAPERAKQRHYQAWQIINGARGAPGDAGRRAALEDLIKDHVMMFHLDLKGSDLRSMDFRGIQASGLNLTDAEIDGVSFGCRRGFFLTEHWWPTYRSCWNSDLGFSVLNTDIERVDFSKANLKRARIGDKSASSIIQHAVLSSRFDRSIMTGARLDNLDIIGTSFDNANMNGVMISDVAFGDGVSFVDADLSQSFWSRVVFHTAPNARLTDLTGADLTEARVLNPDFSYRWIIEADFTPGASRLCHTRLPGGVSDRDCDKRNAMQLPPPPTVPVAHEAEPSGSVRIAPVVSAPTSGR